MPWSGAAQTGSREYDDSDVARVLEALPRGREHRMKLESLCVLVQMDARTVRQIIADRDGLDFVMAYENDLIYDADFFEQAIPHTEKLRARARSELARVGRRERYAAAKLQRRQEMMAL